MRLSTTFRPLRTFAVGCVVAAVISGGCDEFNVTGGDEEPKRPPPLAPIEPLNEPAPALSFDTTLPSQARPRLVARLRLREPNEDYTVYVADFVPDRLGRTVCFLRYLARGDGQDDDDLGPNDSTCVDPREVIGLHREVGSGNETPRVLAGVVYRNINALRIEFSECGVATYPLRGPLLPSEPSRRIFIIDDGDDCRWYKAQALRDGVVVEEVLKPEPPSD